MFLRSAGLLWRSQPSVRLPFLSIAVAASHSCSPTCSTSFRSPSMSKRCSTYARASLPSVGRARARSAAGPWIASLTRGAAGGRYSVPSQKRTCTGSARCSRRPTAVLIICPCHLLLTSSMKRAARTRSAQDFEFDDVAFYVIDVPEADAPPAPQNGLFALQHELGLSLDQDVSPVRALVDDHELVAPPLEPGMLARCASVRDVDVVGGAAPHGHLAAAAIEEQRSFAMAQPQARLCRRLRRAGPLRGTAAALLP